MSVDEESSTKTGAVRSVPLVEPLAFDLTDLRVVRATETDLVFSLPQTSRSPERMMP